jgi:ech hydrogenase subunit D
MSAATEQIFEIITVESLLDKVRAKRAEGCRLVQIGATRLPEQNEVTYSFDLDGRLTNLRLQIPIETRIPSITSIYWCAFLYENEMHDLFNLQVDGIAIDFKGNFYKTAVKYAFGSTKAPAHKPAPAAPAPVSAPVVAPLAPATNH